MNDIRTDEQKYQHWLAAVNFCASKGWRCVSGWKFKSPTGTHHDLSASDLTQLDRIEKEKLCLA